MSTPTERPSAENRTPPETPATIARAIVTLATGAPAHSFWALMKNEVRDEIARLIATGVSPDEITVYGQEDFGVKTRHVVSF